MRRVSLHPLLLPLPEARNHRSTCCVSSFSSLRRGGNGFLFSLSLCLLFLFFVFFPLPARSATSLFWILFGEHCRDCRIFASWIINYPLAEIWIKFSEIVESTEEKSRIRCTSRRIHPSESSVATSLRSLRVTNRKRGQWSRRFVASIKRSKNLINELENVTNYITQCISQMIYQDNQGLFLHSVATFFWEDQKRLWTVGREITADN